MSSRTAGSRWRANVDCGSSPHDSACRASHPARLPRACPGCGAPVEFRQRAVHPCGLQLLPQHGRAQRRDAGAHGQDGRAVRRLQPAAVVRQPAAGEDKAFTLVGRLQYRGPSGPWTEWNARSTTAQRACWARTTAPMCSRCRRRLQRDASAGRAVARRRDHRDRRQALHRRLQRAGRAGLGAGRAAQAAAAGPALRGGGTAQRRGQVLSIDYGTRAAGRLPRPRGPARRPAAHRAARRSAQGGEGPQLQLPELRRAGDGRPGRQQERHLPRPATASSTCRRASAANCGMRPRTSRCSR